MFSGNGKSPLLDCGAPAANREAPPGSVLKKGDRHQWLAIGDLIAHLHDELRNS
jgi:hypothetical protein